MKCRRGEGMEGRKYRRGRGRAKRGKEKRGKCRGGRERERKMK